MRSENNVTWLIKYLLFAIALVCCAFGMLLLYNKLFPESPVKYLPTSLPSDVRRIVIDAGHGGRDGGAVSVTGTAEKSLNLETSKMLCEAMRLLGYEVIMTRETDTELTADSGSRKMQDLKGRLKIAESNPDALFISIHMNKFPKSKYSGLQVYYSKNDSSSSVFARNIQGAVRTYLQKDNDREVKPATSAIYLLDRIKTPAVLIECGFLSNENEAKLLDTPSYRLELCLVLASALSAWENN